MKVSTEKTVDRTLPKTQADRPIFQSAESITFKILFKEEINLRHEIMDLLVIWK